jgi:predicted TIM-barrel enzyme
MIEPRPLNGSARLACIKLADAVIVTGDASGNSPTAGQLREAAAGVVESGREVPLLIGSGLDEENAQELLAHCSGAIVGTSIMRDKSVDAGAARSLITQTRGNGQ